MDLPLLKEQSSEMWESVWIYLSKGLHFASDLITVILGCMALYGIIVHRDKISAFARLLSTTFLNERVKRLKEVLGALHNLNFEEKGDRSKIYANLGAISGQVKQLALSDERFRFFHEELTIYLERKKRLNEPTKNRLMFELHGLLDSLSENATKTILEDSDGSKSN
jgi:hypothetical protein